MNTFKKKSLYAALAGASALGVTGAAHAVNVNPDGLGQVLIYPYYTIQDKVPGAAFSSLLSVVNSTASSKAVKVRFLEGKNSQEVLDFNLFLSPKDVWTAAVLPAGVGAGVATFDKSCTVPKVSSDADEPERVRQLLVRRRPGRRRPRADQGRLRRNHRDGRAVRHHGHQEHHPRQRRAALHQPHRATSTWRPPRAACSAA